MKSFLVFFYQDAFFNPEMAPDLASRNKLNLENFLKVLLSLALELVKTHHLAHGGHKEYANEGGHGIQYAGSQLRLR